MKNKILALLLTLIPLYSVHGQIYQPVKWQFSHQKIEANKYKLTFSASIEPGWHLYSVFLDEGGPIATSINYENENDYTSKGDVIENPAPKKHYDTTFEMDLAYWSNKAKITQIIEVKEGVKTIEGYVEFMVCDDAKCLPPDQADFSFKLN